MAGQIHPPGLSLSLSTGLLSLYGEKRMLLLVPIPNHINIARKPCQIELLLPLPDRPTSGP